MNHQLHKTSTLRDHLQFALSQREPSLDIAKIQDLVEPLLEEAALWAKRMELKDIGVRLEKTDSSQTLATLCDHTVDGCDCGH
jgi:hypothetical protein